MAKTKAYFRFNNFSLKQKMVLEWWTPDSPYKDKNGIICDGSIRAGKTTAMSFSFVVWAMETFDEENFAMCGKTINSLRRNVIKQLKRILISRGYGVHEHRAENYITISKGDISNDFYLFGGRDESSQDIIQGITLAGLFMDEVALMPESFVNQAVGRCSIEGSKTWFNCNPDSPNHFFKLKWIDRLTEKDLIRIHFTMDDNPSLSAKMIARYKSWFVGVFYDRFISGLWVMAEGLIFPMYKNAIVKEMPEGRSEKTIFSVDYGTMNAFSMMQWDLYDDVWYGHKLYYYSGREEAIQKTDAEYLEEIEKHFAERINLYREDLKIAHKEELLPPERLKVIIDPSAASFIALMKKQDWAKVIKGKNDVLNGLRETATAIHTGKIKILDNEEMEPWKKEAGGYVWDKKAGEKGVERPVKVNDHAMDATRYFVKTMKLVKIEREMEEEEDMA